MKKKYLKSLLNALRHVTISNLSEEDQFSVIDNIIDITDEVEKLEKTEQEAIKKFIPEDFEKLDRQQKAEINAIAARKINDFMTPKYEEESKIVLKPVSDKTIQLILKQKEEITTNEKALIVKFLKKR